MKLIITLLALIGTIIAFSQPAESRKLNFNAAFQPFYHGVASGDPEADRVIIWTRVTPDSASTSAITVIWKIGTDTLINNIVNSGTVTADAYRDYTVKVDVTGLNPNTTYYYNFKALGRQSLTGRTKTNVIGDTDSLRFAVVSCANYEAGYFNAYAGIAKRNDIDAVLHLGDYIYEHEQKGYGHNYLVQNRDYEPVTETISLAEYRMRYSLYHLDEDVQNLHQQYPMINIWDDHESADNSYSNGAKNHDIIKEGSWQTRKSASMKAFNEWIPIREDAGSNDTVIYRKFSFGTLMDLYMLDSRLFGRDKQDGTSNTDINRTMLGKTQLQWLKSELKSGTAKWNIVGQQVMVAPLKAFGVPVNEDQWDGYPVERDNLLNFIQNDSINDVVILTGDIHSSWANDLKINSKPSAVEFVATSITSPGFSNLAGLSSVTLQLLNPHIEFIDLSEKGYIILDVNKKRTVSEWYYVPTINTRTDAYVHETSWLTNYGDHFLLPGGAPTLPRAGLNVPFAPDSIYNQLITETKQTPQAVIFGIYPNPVKNYLTLQYYLEKSTSINISITDLTGRISYIKSNEHHLRGLNLSQLDMSQLAFGIYLLTIEGEEFKLTRRVIRE